MLLRFSLFSLAIFMLVALMHLSQGETTTELPFLLQRIKKNTKTRMRNQIDTRISEFRTIFGPPTGATTEKSTTTTEAGQFNVVQSIIEVPKRCPSGSDYIHGSCRTRIN